MFGLDFVVVSKMNKYSYSIQLKHYLASILEQSISYYTQNCQTKYWDEKGYESQSNNKV